MCPSLISYCSPYSHMLSSSLSQWHLIALAVPYYEGCSQWCGFCLLLTLSLKFGTTLIQMQDLCQRKDAKEFHISDNNQDTFGCRWGCTIFDWVNLNKLGKMVINHQHMYVLSRSDRKLHQIINWYQIQGLFGHSRCPMQPCLLPKRFTLMQTLQLFTKSHTSHEDQTTKNSQVLDDVF